MTVYLCVPLNLPFSQVFPKRKAAEFDRSGRPFHSFFYTRFPNFYEMMHNVAVNMQECDKHEDAAIRYVAVAI
jgi:small subunit ribosomal protein S9